MPKIKQNLILRWVIAFSILTVSPTFLTSGSLAPDVLGSITTECLEKCGFDCEKNRNELSIDQVGSQGIREPIFPVTLPVDVSDKIAGEDLEVKNEEEEQTRLTMSEGKSSDTNINLENSTLKEVNKKKKKKKNRRKNQAILGKAHEEFPLENDTTEVHGRDVNKQLGGVNERVSSFEKLQNSNGSAGGKAVAKGQRKSTTKDHVSEGKSVSDLFKDIPSDATEEEIEMKHGRMEKIKSAFQPFPSTSPGEILQGVIKGKWSEMVHDSKSLPKIVLMMLQIEQNSQVKLSKKELEDFIHYGRSLMAFEILKNHLKLSKIENYLPLGCLSDKTYQTLKFLWNSNPKFITGALENCETIQPPLGKYELHRRILTLATQIVQKTIVENWVIIRQHYIHRKKPSITFLNQFEDYFQTKKEFPPLIYWSINIQYPRDTMANDPLVMAQKLVPQILGKFEFHRRFQIDNFLVKTKPEWKLSIQMWEDLRMAEKQNGVNFWNVFHFIHYLGLGEEDDIASWGLVKVIWHIENLTKITLHQAWYREISWYQSADSYWLIKTFPKEYYQKINSLCERGKNLICTLIPDSTKHKKDNYQERENMNNIIPQRIQDRRAEFLLLGIHGLNTNLLPLIESLKEKYTHKDGHINWESVWNNLPPGLEVPVYVKVFFEKLN